MREPTSAADRRPSGDAVWSCLLPFVHDVVRFTVKAAGRRRRGRWLRQDLALLAFLFGFLPLQCLHWLGFLLDEIFHRGYRDQRVERPLFILGLPRSGTTHLHRTLSRDPYLLTVKTWECLLAPSVAQRRAIQGLAAVDHLLGGWGNRLVGCIASRLASATEVVHPIELGEAEEDFFLLLPILRCFVLTVPFPEAEEVWRMARFDREVPAAERERVLRFYEALLKKHLYAHGADRRLLSKNASFAGMASSLLDRFPDARVIRCRRDPGEVLGSQLSSLRQALHFFGRDARDPVFTERMVGVLRGYDRNLDRTSAQLPRTRWVEVEMRDLQRDLFGQVAASYWSLRLPLSGEFARSLRREAVRASAYRSKHEYRLEEFGLEQAEVAATWQEGVSMT